MKTRYFALLALVLGMASCQRDIASIAGSNDEVSVQLSVAAPELVGLTRADDEQNPDLKLNSAFGAIDYLDNVSLNDAGRWDWNDVDLRYSLEIYDANEVGEGPIKDRMVIIKDKYEPANFELRLIPDRKYRFAIFADFVPQGAAAEVNPEIEAQRNLGLRHTIGTTLREITIKQRDEENVLLDNINDEIADAYFKSFDYTPANNTHNYVNDSEPVVLKRPYGKVRIVTTDLAELNENVHPKVVKIVYDEETEIATTFNAVSGSIGGAKDKDNKACESVLVDAIRNNRANHYYNCDYDAMTATAANGKVRASHLTLATDYILAVKDEEGQQNQNTIQFMMYVYEDADATKLIKEVEFSTQIPVQRNYLTTIVGNFLTVDTKIEVTIDDNFDGYHDYDADDDSLTTTTTISVANHEELVEAVKPDNLVKGTTIIKLTEDIAGDVTIAQNANTNVIIDGCDHNFAGYIVVDGKSATYTTAGLTIKDINFNAESISADACIRLGDGSDATRYTCNVTVDNCTFDVPGAVAVKSYTGGDKNLTVTNCTATANAHSLVQAKGIDGILVEKCNICSKNGLNFNNSTNVVVKKCKADVKGYAVRFGEAKGGSGAAEVYTIEDSTLKSACEEDGDAVIIIRGTADYSTLTLKNTTLEGEPDIINTATGAKVVVE